MASHFEYPLIVLLFFYILIVVFALIFLAVSILCAVSFYDFFNHHPITQINRACEHYLEIEQRADLFQKCLELKMSE